MCIKRKTKYLSIILGVISIYAGITTGSLPLLSAGMDKIANEINITEEVKIGEDY